jgi:hypothetical protein
MSTCKLMTNVIAAPTTAVAVVSGWPSATYQASVVGTGAVTATVIIEATNEPNATAASQYITHGTITLNGTTNATDGFPSTAVWGAVRARLTAISGTSATVNVTAGYA